jgi:hypothetical protein
VHGSLGGTDAHRNLIRDNDSVQVGIAQQNVANVKFGGG